MRAGAGDGSGTWRLEESPASFTSRGVRGGDALRTTTPLSTLPRHWESHEEGRLTDVLLRPSAGPDYASVRANDWPGKMRTGQGVIKKCCQNNERGFPSSADAMTSFEEE